jgi:hypothetical protein
VGKFLGLTSIKNIFIATIYKFIEEPFKGPWSSGTISACREEIFS